MADFTKVFKHPKVQQGFAAMHLLERRADRDTDTDHATPSDLMSFMRVADPRFKQLDANTLTDCLHTEPRLFASTLAKHNQAQWSLRDPEVRFSHSACTAGALFFQHAAARPEGAALLPKNPRSCFRYLINHPAGPLPISPASFTFYSIRQRKTTTRARHLQRRSPAAQWPPCRA